MKRNHTQDFCSRYGNYRQDETVTMRIDFHPTKVWAFSCGLCYEVDPILFRIQDDAIEFARRHHKEDHPSDTVALSINN